MTTALRSRPKKRPAVAASRKPASGAHESFNWPLANEAERLLRDRVDLFLESNSFASRLAERMRAETGTDFFEWIDHIALSPDDEPALGFAGYVEDSGVDTPEGERVFEHPRATLPRVLLRPKQKRYPSHLALRPEFVADFIASHSLAADPEGEIRSRFRRVVVSRENGTQLEAVERRAYRGFTRAPLKPGELKAILKARELWQTRPRQFASDAEGVAAAYSTLDRVLSMVDRDTACQLFFEAERAYWDNRNRAARIQKHRQDQLGLGWGNHDHHTFRCSRAHFVDLVEFLLQLGFVKRERYYAGAEAGWGAQISEQPTVGVVVFADVDLMPDETKIDFSTTKLPQAPKLGTVGLWTGLHGESFLEAGMHHLEARFEFDLLREQLKAEGVNTMKPFSEFEFLHQAFTEGERWPVKRERAEALLAAGLITSEQCGQFIANGAIGSHLENLQRHGGFKGFNQKSVSVVIEATDPRRNHFNA
jgi:hypothetical protein